MGNIISFLQAIFMGKDNDTLRVGLTEFKKSSPISYKSKRKSLFSVNHPQELRLSELMRKGA
jgi:hypothetical protein